MAIRWVDGRYSTSLGFLGEMEIGSIGWVSGRNPGEASGHQFRSSLFANVPHIAEEGIVHSDVADAKKEAELKAAMFAEHIFKAVHGEKTWNLFMGAGRGA